MEKRHSIDELKEEIARLKARCAKLEQESKSADMPMTYERLVEQSHKIAERLRKRHNLGKAKINTGDLEGLFAPLISSKTNSVELVKADRNGEL